MISLELDMIQSAGSVSMTGGHGTVGGFKSVLEGMANMSAVCFKYHYTVKPFLIIPIVGAVFTDLFNTGLITLFLNLI